MSKYSIIALCGPSGCGKNKILDSTISYAPDKFNRIVGFTTRPPRECEKNGKDYYFITEREFINKRQLVLESSIFNGWIFGTFTSELSENKKNIGIFSPSGIRQLLRNPRLDVTVYNLLASDKTRLIRQLNREKNPNVKEIIRRFGTDEKDFDLTDIFCYNIRNEEYSDIQRVCNAIIGMEG